MLDALTDQMDALLLDKIAKASAVLDCIHNGTPSPGTDGINQLISQIQNSRATTLRSLAAKAALFGRISPCELFASVERDIATLSGGGPDRVCRPS